LNYIVQRGDTLSKISRRYGTTVAKILRLNPQIKNPDLIFVGQKITLPGSRSNPPQATPSTKMAYLTFDDGPSANTPIVLDILKAQGIKATFFVIGNETPQGISMYKRIVAEGHRLGNHTYTHNYASIYQSMQNFLGDFFRLEKLLQNVVGVKPSIIRYPGGSSNTVSHRHGGAGIMRQIMAEMAKRGYRQFDWNVDSGDATHALKDSSLILRNTLNQAAGRNDAIILLHDGAAQQATTVALPKIIHGLRSRGFSFGTLS
jgi:peptidoglycan-N-acetylglucosamine deacetylase